MSAQPSLVVQPFLPDGVAHIVITLDEFGSAKLRSFFCGRFDASYRVRPDAAVLAELPKLLAELRAQMAALPATESL